jgi:hypothetical protein
MPVTGSLEAFAGMLLIGVGLTAIDGRLPTAIRNKIKAAPPTPD